MFEVQKIGSTKLSAISRELGTPVGVRGLGV